MWNTIPLHGELTLGMTLTPVANAQTLETETQGFTPPSATQAATQEEDRTKVAEMNGEIASLDAAIAAFEAGAD